MKRFENRLQAGSLLNKACRLFGMTLLASSMALTGCDSQGGDDLGSAELALTDGKVECKVAYLGDDDTCFTPAEWKKYIYLEVLSQYGDDVFARNASFAKSCEKGHFKAAKVQICRPVVEEIDTVEELSCKTRELHAKEVGSCLTPSDWKGIAAKSCDKDGATLTHASLGEECGQPGTFERVKFECCLTPEVPEVDDGTPVVEVEDVEEEPTLDEGPAMTCKSRVTHAKEIGQCLTPSEWKGLAMKYCAADNAKATAIKLGEGCSKKDGTFASAKYICCALDAPAIDDAPVIDDEPTDLLEADGPQCKVISEATPGDCRSADEWKMFATKTCTLNDATAQALKLGTACKEKGTFDAAKFMCCANEVTVDDISDDISDDTTPLTPPSECFGAAIDVKQCLTPAELKAMAYKSCAKKDTELVKGLVGNACKEKGTFHSMKFQCCAPTVIFPETSDESDVDEDINDDTSVDEAPQCKTSAIILPKTCEPVSFWKKTITKTCGASHAVVSRVSLAGECKKGGFSAAKFECCIE